jgi:hypothetical protein
MTNRFLWNVYGASGTLIDIMCIDMLAFFGGYVCEDSIFNGANIDSSAGS